MSFSHFSNNKNTATNTTGTFGSDLIQSIQSCGKNAIDEQDRVVAVETAVSILNNLPTVQDIHLKNASGRTALWYAVDVGSAEMVDRLLQRGGQASDGDQEQWSTIHVSCDQGYALILSKLLQSQPSQHHIETLIYSQTTGPQWTPMHLAVSNGHSKCCQQLLLAGANVEATTTDSYTPLLLCSTGTSNGHLSCARMLLDRGANADVVDPIDRETPLHKACRCGTNEMAELLLGYGATIQLDAQGFSPIAHALARGFDWNIIVQRRERRQDVDEAIENGSLGGSTNKFK